MMNKIKAISLAAFAIAAMSMIGASAVQAANGELHVTNTPGKADITGAQTVQHTFKLTASGATTQCTQALFEGTISNEGVTTQTTASEATLTPQYTGCEITSPVGASAEVKMNGCKYTITSGVSPLTSNVDISGCTTGKFIEIIGGGCTVTVPPQGALSHIVYANNGAGESQDVIAQITVQGIQYTTEGLFCILGSSQRSDGDYTGTATFKGFVDQGTTTTTTHNGHQFAKLIPGQQRGVFAT